MKRLLVALSVVVVLCAPGLAQPTDPFGRTDTQKELELGREFYELVIRQEWISNNEAYKRRVSRVFSQLLSAMPQKLYPYQAIVLANNVPNAGCFAGGFILVNEGLLTIMPDDNELASVLAHEIGHASRRHWARQSRKTATDLSLQILISVVFNSPVNEAAISLATLQYSRDHEYEADSFGTELYLRAGFDPQFSSAGMRSLASFVKKLGGSHGPEYLNTHPDIHKRIARIDDLTTKLRASGLTANTVTAPDLSVEAVFGKIPTISPAKSKWLTISPGCKWDYETRGAGGGVSTYSIKTLGISEIGATPIAMMELQIGGQVIPYQFIVDGERFWRRNRPSDSKSSWQPEWIIPELGSIEGDDNRHFQSLAIEDVDTPAGKFEGTIKIRVKESSRTLLMWLAPDVGLVKRVNEKTGLVEVLTKWVRP